MTAQGPLQTRRYQIEWMVLGTALLMEAALLRIAQEALMNATKYSQANEIRIALTARAEIPRA